MPTRSTITQVTSLDIRQLECFVAVAEEGHVGRAAARLYMTQPPLTRRITRLEREIGVRLFRRTTAGMELTAAGAVLLDRTRRIVRLTAHAVERTRLADAGRVGTLVVGYFGSTVFDAVPRLLRGFLTQHPDVTLALERADKNDQAEALRDGRMHVGFGRLYREEPGLQVRRIERESLHVAVPTTHALRGQDGVRAADLRDEELVLFPASPRPSFADEISQLCTDVGFTPRVTREAEDILAALAYVATNGGCSVVPRSAVNIALPGVAFLPLADGPLQDLSCMYRSGEPTPVLAAFLRYLDTLPGA